MKLTNNIEIIEEYYGIYEFHNVKVEDVILYINSGFYFYREHLN